MQIIHSDPMQSHPHLLFILKSYIYRQFEPSRGLEVYICQDTRVFILSNMIFTLKGVIKHQAGEQVSS